MSLKVKMILLCLVIASAGMIAAVVSYNSVTKVANEYNPIVTENLPLVLKLGDLKGTFRELRIQIRSIAFVGTQIGDVVKHVKATQEHVVQIDDIFANYEKTDDQALKRPSFRDLKRAWLEFKDFGGVLIENAKDYDTHQATIVDLIRRVCPEKAEKFYKALDVETKIQMDEVQASTHEALETEKSAKQLTILFSLITILGAVVIAYVFSTRLSTAFSRIVAKLTEENTQVTVAAQSMAQSGVNLASSSNSAAATLEETVASIEELTSMVKFNSDNAKEAAVISQDSRIAAEKGEKEMDSLMAAMAEISESSKKIKDIITVIDDIAFQTNLLALNAAVEAARAGEQGKGFAVVAEAVRSLAQRSSSAAKDISQLIQDSVEKIERGSQTANIGSTVLQNIVASVKKVSELNQEISEASTEQSVGIQQINKAMNELDRSVQTNAASAKEIADFSQEINTLSVAALELTNQVNRTVRGNKKAA